MILKFKKYFIVWWIPILTYILIFGVFILGCALQRDWIIDTFLILFFINILGVFISSIVQIFIKKWYFIIPQIGISIILYLWVSIVFTFSPPDYYGAHKKIPDGIEIYEPIENKPTEKDFINHNLVVSSSFQPGIYNYHTNYITTEFGYFYIKVFEITSNDKLSQERIRERSKVKVDDLEIKIQTGRFTIYEGDWGHKYGSRIELWFQSNNGKEFKVSERNYIVEGWMR